MKIESYRLNIWKIYIFSFLTSLHFFGAVLVPFFTDWGKISFTQIMILQSWFMFWIFALEIPTGAVADYLGRKWSIILGALATIVAVLVYTSSPNFYIFLLGEFIWAISAALFSGADEALVYDTLKEAGKENLSKKIFGIKNTIHLTGIMLASMAGGFIASKFGLKATMTAVIIPTIFALIIGLSIKEPKITSEKQIKKEKNYLKVIKDGLKYFKNHKVLKIITFDFLIIEVIGYLMIWLFQPMLIRAGLSLTYFGLVHAAFLLSQILIINNYTRFEKLLKSKKKIILLSALIPGILYIIGGLTNVLVITIAVIVIGGGIALSAKTLRTSYLNKHIESEKRATVLSTVSMILRIAIAIVNPIVGFLANWSLMWTLVILGFTAIISIAFHRIEEKHLID
ncbi:MAG: MFS transporter [archaeon]